MPTEQELTVWRLATLEAKTETLEKCQETMSSDIKEIKDKLLLRPSWAVTIIITFLSTVCVWLSVFVLTNWSTKVQDKNTTKVEVLSNF